MNLTAWKEGTEPATEFAINAEYRRSTDTKQCKRKTCIDEYIDGTDRLAQGHASGIVCGTVATRQIDLSRLYRVSASATEWMAARVVAPLVRVFRFVSRRARRNKARESAHY